MPQAPTELDDEEADAAAMSAAIEVARADRRGMSHAEMREWLLKVAAGDLAVEPPTPRTL